MLKMRMCTLKRHDMKRYLYEIDCNGWHDQRIPFMPRVLAEKTAKALNRGKQRKSPRFTVSKTHIVVKDATPHGYSSWYEYYGG